MPFWYKFLFYHAMFVQISKFTMPFGTSFYFTMPFWYKFLICHVILVHISNLPCHFGSDFSEPQTAFQLPRLSRPADLSAHRPEVPRPVRRGSEARLRHLHLAGPMDVLLKKRAPGVDGKALIPRFNEDSLFFDLVVYAAIRFKRSFLALYLVWWLGVNLAHVLSSWTLHFLGRPF